MTEYEPQKRVKEDSTSTECIHCNQIGREHDKERVYHENGTYSYNYVCNND